MQYLLVGFFPINAPTEVAVAWNGKLPPESWEAVVEKCRVKSLRQVGKDYGVSHEAVRRTLLRTDGLGAGNVR